MPPITPDDDPKLQKLDAEVKAARAEYEKDYNPKSNDDGESINVGARAGVELVGAIIGGAVIGYGIDSYFGTTPIFFLVLTLLGVVTGFYNIYKITMNFGTSVGFKGLKSDEKDAKQGQNFDDDDS